MSTDTTCKRCGVGQDTDGDGDCGTCHWMTDAQAEGLKDLRANPPVKGRYSDHPEWQNRVASAAQAKEQWKNMLHVCEPAGDVQFSHPGSPDVFRFMGIIKSRHGDLIDDEE